eukprot:gene53295-65095_t
MGCWLGGFRASDNICRAVKESVEVVPTESSHVASPDVPVEDAMWGMVVLQKEVPPETEEEKSKRKGKGGKGYRMERERTVLPAVLDEVFGMVHHPASPLTS